jgi:hypothetical protein
MKKANKWIGFLIIGVISLVQGIGFGQAFVMLDARFIADYATFAGLLVVAGLALGLSIETGIAYSAAMYPGMRGKKEIRLTQAALVSLLAIAPLVLTPVRLYSMDAGLKASMFPLVAVGVVFLFSVAPSIVTVMVAVVNREAFLVKSPGAVSEGATGAVAVGTVGAAGAKSANAKSANAKSARRAKSGPGAVAVGAKSEQGAVGWPRQCEHCDGIIGTPNAKGAHMKKHHPELCIRKAIPVEAIK